jgi:hypothetical protein
MGEGIEELDLPHIDELIPARPAAETWTEFFTSGCVSSDRADALTAGAHAAGISVREFIHAA